MPGEQLKYTVEVTGELLEGRSADEAKAAFCATFNVDKTKVEKYFQGKSRVLQRHLDAAQADTYEQALRSVGLTPRRVPEQPEEPKPAEQPKQAPALELVAIESPAQASEPEQPLMVCPKCRTTQPRAEQCGECGIFVRKYTPPIAAEATVPRTRSTPASSAADTDADPGAAAMLINASPDSMNLPSIAAAAAAAVAGAVLWMLIAVNAGMEFGIVAWGIGGAVGVASVLMGGRGQANGILCGALALTAIMGGKFLTAEALKDQVADSLAQQTLASTEAVALYEELREDARLYRELDGSDADLRHFLVTRGYSEAESENGVSDQELAEFNEYNAPTLLWIDLEQPSFEQWQAHTVETIQDFSSADIIAADFGFLSALFVIFGIATAFRIGSGAAE